MHMSQVGKRGNGRTTRRWYPTHKLDDGCITISVWVGQRRVKTLIDTGAASSFINEGVAATCRRNLWHTNREYLSAVMADGKEADIDESMEGIVNILNRKVNHSFYVLTSLPHEMILGMDILNKIEYQASIFGIPIIPDTQTHTTTLPISPPKKRKCDICLSENLQPRQTHGSAGLKSHSADEADRLKRFLETELPKFDNIKGPTPLIKHHIKLKDPTPVKQRYQPRNPITQKIIDEESGKMYDEGIIEASNSPWSSPVVIARRKNGKPRFCVDFRRVNKQCERDVYPLPQINATLDKLRGARYLSTIDLKNGYWQVALTEESKPITAFTVPGRGLMQYFTEGYTPETGPSSPDGGPTRRRRNSGTSRGQEVDPMADHQRNQV